MRYFLLCCLLPAALHALGQSAGTDTLEKVNELIRHHQYEEALGLLPSGASRDIKVCNLSGYILTRLGRLPEAKEAYHRSLELDSTDFDALNSLARLYKETGDYLLAFSHYDRLIRSDSTNGFLYRQAADCLYRGSRSEGARRFYQLACMYNPSDLLALTALGKVYLEEKSYRLCDSVVSLGLELDTANRQLTYLKARSAFLQDKHPLALSRLQRLFSAGDSSIKVMQMAGVAYFHVNRYDSCVFWLERLPEQYADKHETVHYFLGISYRELGETAKSITCLEKAIEAGISDYISLYYHQLGGSLEKAGEIDEALAAFNTALRYQETPLILYQLARIYDWHKRDPEKALRFYRQYLAREDSSLLNIWKFAQNRIAELER